MSCLIPFTFGALSNGNIWFGILSILGVLAIHLGTNIFDDAIDYTKEIIDIKHGLKEKPNLQEGKCWYILNNTLSLKTTYFIAISLFSIGLIIGLFFLHVWGLKLLYIIIPTAILCILYPILGSLGLGEIIVGTIYSVLLYSGVYFVMTGKFSLTILLLSISTGLLVITVLVNHMLLDYKVDENNRKITLCRLCKTEKNALILMSLIITFAYINIIVLFLLQKISIYYLITLISIPFAINLIKSMNNYICSDKQIDQKSFIIKFLLSEKLLSSFTILLFIAIIMDKIL
jgi:1,4-dihydroxy-2-naphthoate octaprenyltransferase